MTVKTRLTLLFTALVAVILAIFAVATFPMPSTNGCRRVLFRTFDRRYRHSHDRSEKRQFKPSNPSTVSATNA